MIFVTVGEQLPFDRLIKSMDAWAKTTNHEVFAQIGRSTYQPTTLQFDHFLDHNSFQSCLQQASLIVAHAGMGTIISALELNKPVIVVPRKASLGEHRNDHQLATAKRFSALHYVKVAFDQEELYSAIETFLEGESDEMNPSVSIEPASDLIETIRDFLSQ